MLCRALVTAIAISCTFSEVIGQATPRNVHKKDLICVLWLSGMQKEDLDVNLLRKLQRHNVNIDQMNSETLRRDCLNLSKDDKAKKVTSTSEKSTTTVVTKPESKRNIKHLLQTNFEDIVTDLMIEQFPIKKNTTYTADNNTKRPVINNKFQTRDNEDYLTKAIMSSEAITTPGTGDNAATKSVDNKPDIEKIIQFWQIFRTTHTPDKIEELTTQQNIERPSVYKNLDTDLINKLLEKLSLKSNMETTQKPITTPSVDLNKLSQKIEKLLDFFPQNEKPNSSKQINEKHDRIEIDLAKYTMSNENHFVIPDVPVKAVLQAQRKQHYRNHYEPIVNANNYTNQLSSSMPPGNIVNNVTGAPLVTLKEDTITKKEDKIISKDVIKEIAENIKALVLKDLRKEITSTSTIPSSVSPFVTVATSTMTQTTTSVATTSVTVSEKARPKTNQDAEKIMEKFISLFEQFKALKETPHITGKLKVKVTKEVVSKPKYKNPLNVNIRAPILVVKPNQKNFKMANDEFDNVMFYSPFGIQSLPMKSVIKVNSRNDYNTLKRAPIMMQTNSGEIPPLPIPVSKPLKLIHQNIVVTTSRAIYTKQKKSWSNTHIEESNFKDITRVSSEKIQKHHTTPPKLSSPFEPEIISGLKSQKVNMTPTERKPNINAKTTIKDETISSPKFDNDKTITSKQEVYKNSGIETTEQIRDRLAPRIDNEKPSDPMSVGIKQHDDDRNNSQYEQRKSFDKKSYEKPDSKNHELNQRDPRDEQFDGDIPKSPEPTYYKNGIINNRNSPQKSTVTNEKQISPEKKFLDETKYQKSNPTRFESEKQKYIQKSSERVKVPDENYRQGRFNEDKPLKSFQNNKNERPGSLEESHRLPQYGGDKLKQFQEYKEKSLEQFTKNERVRNYEAETRLPRYENDQSKLNTEQYKYDRPRNKDVGLLPAQFNDQTNPLDHSSYTIESPRNHNIYNPSRFDNEKQKKMEHPTTNDKLKDIEYIHLPQYDKDKFKAENQEKAYLGFENDRLKLFDQSPYKRIIDHEPSRFYDEKLKPFEQSFNQRERFGNEGNHQWASDRLKQYNQDSYRVRNEDDGHVLPRFEVDKLELLENPYKTGKSEKIKDDRRPPYFEDKIKYMDETPYKSTRIKNEKYDYPPPIFDEQTSRIKYQNVRPPVPNFENDKRNPYYLESRISNQSGNRMHRFEDILNTRSDEDKPRMYNIKSKYRDDKISVGAFRGRDRERFHEILEKADNWRDVADRKNANREMSLTSRQQQPLNDAKKTSRFDDTHFKNFLKTQQKVNDMLEKILAVKTGDIGPRSVETT